MTDHLKHIPHLGSGIGFRPELKSYIFLNRDKIDFIEIIADHYMDAPQFKQKELELLKEHFVVIPHAIGLSLGSAAGIDDCYLQKLADLIRYLNPPYWSEHIAYTQAHGIDVGHLSPLVYNSAFLNILQENMARVKKIIPCPLILENITYHIDLPGREYGDAEFLNEVCRRTGCGLLLDITNLFINSRNFNFDPYHFIDRLETGHVVQLHYVGYEEFDGQVIDTHASRTQAEIFDLLHHVIKKRTPKGVILERDERYGQQDEITEDLLKARQLMKSRSDE